MSLKRINLNLDETLLTQLDGYAKTMHVTRSAAISFLLTNFFRGQEQLATISDMLDVYHKENNK